MQSLQNSKVWMKIVKPFIATLVLLILPGRRAHTRLSLVDYMPNMPVVKQVNGLAISGNKQTIPIKAGQALKACLGSLRYPHGRNESDTPSKYNLYMFLSFECSTPAPGLIKYCWPTEDDGSVLREMKPMNCIQTCEFWHPHNRWRRCTDYTDKTNALGRLQLL